MITYAHTATRPDGSPDHDKSHWQPLAEHLEQVSFWAATFADTFGAADWARLAGLWHDLGKYSEEFQRYLASAGGTDAHLEERPEIAAKVDHSTAGAQHAHAVLARGYGTLLAYLIAGHHAGLPDGLTEAAVGSDLSARLKKRIPAWREFAPAKLVTATPLPFPPLLRQAEIPHPSFATAFFLRMVFSALVDADFLDTEAFMSPDRADARPTRHPTMAEIEAAFSAYYRARFPAPQNDVQRARADVHAACLARAEEPPGLFSLEVPTGGGKTFASLAFALRHARLHGLRRIVYVIPFTSIIEQNAAEFRRALAALGPDVVLEHHSNLADDAPHATATSRLAAENWDAPIVITTNVQFFESLFAHRTSRCRKLHRLAQSVIILDEAQALPVEFLQPCLAALGELVRGYGTSIVLCTATQPALEARPSFTIGLSAARPIIADAPALAARLRRTRCQHAGLLDDDTLAARLAAEPRALCIVNTRAHARALFTSLRATSPQGTWHLSALMCPEHRSRKLAEIRARLAASGDCRVVSTQLVEAGVDLDFPTVYRALAGLDSLAQAAGRCNREGKLTDAHGTPRLGEVWVFDTAERPPSFLRAAADNAAQVLALPDFAADPLAPAAVRRYFELHYWSQQSRWDDRRVMACFGNIRQDPLLLRFATAAERFRLIDQPYEPVVIPYDDHAAALLAPLHRGGPLTAGLLRQLQRYTVQIPERVARTHLGTKLIRLADQLTVLPDVRHNYSDDLGLDLDDPENVFLA